MDLLCSSLFLVLFVTGVRCVDPSLEIYPVQPVVTKAVGKSVLLTCKFRVQDPSLVSEFRWLDIHNQTIDDYNLFTRDRFSVIYTQAEPALSLVIKNLLKNDEGVYTCVAKYANTIVLSKSVTLSPIVAITWEDAPQEQYPIAGQDYRIRCKVRAEPPPHIEWTLNNRHLPPTDRYVEDPEGLLIQQVTQADDGVYTCRAFVIETGELAERPIKIEVHTHPKMLDSEMTTSIDAVEGESASLQCLAEGKPLPLYNWIQLSTQKNLAQAERFTVNERTGVLDITRVVKEDAGEYKCVASNGAGNVEKKFRLSVVLKPQVLDIKNISSPVGKEARLECRALGFPLPSITFRKLSSSQRMIVGLQPSDDRIIVDQAQDKLLQQSVGILTIFNINRTDDGLYECIASNRGGEAVKNGLIEVQFPPSFEHSPMKEAWSWERRPVNLTCIAESIPNATITWRLNNRDIDKDPNFRKFGKGPVSTLLVTPLERGFYGMYKCVAVNQLGEAFHEISLHEARIPSEIINTVVSDLTATTVRFTFVGPSDTGGRPVMGYSVQFKTDRQSWNEARNQTWPVDTPYILEHLEPQLVYYFRFAAFNEVGQGSWSANRDIRMPERSSPMKPLILNQVLNQTSVTTPVVSPYSDRFELRWKKPQDNGDLIDKYEVEYCTVLWEQNQWKVTDAGCSEFEIPPEGTAYSLHSLSPNTNYKVNLRAHNSFGYSSTAYIYMQTAEDGTYYLVGHQAAVSASSIYKIEFVTQFIPVVLFIFSQMF